MIFLGQVLISSAVVVCRFAEMSSQSIFATLPPITCGALTTATTMYPVDLLRALKMSAAAEGVSKGTGELVKEFHAKHGLKGFVSQGVLPEMLRATYMRVLKFFLFPITHKAVFGTPENKGSAMTKAVAGGLASLPEGFTIQVYLPPAVSPDARSSMPLPHLDRFI